VSKKRSISIVFPHPTSPCMYSPFGRFSGICVLASAGLDLRPKRELRKDVFGAVSNDSSEGRTTFGGVYSLRSSWRSCRC
jgi:hypothetical protein